MPSTLRRVMLAGLALPAVLALAVGSASVQSHRPRIDVHFPRLAGDSAVATPQDGDAADPDLKKTDGEPMEAD